MTSYRDPSWGRFTKFGAILILLFVAWWSVPSSMFFQPVNMTIVKDVDGRWMMASQRILPWGNVSGTWKADVQVLGREEGATCPQNGDAFWTEKETNIARYDITAWAGRCLDAGPPIGVNYERQVWLLGVLPLRPVHYSFVINPDTAPVVDTGVVQK